MRRRRLLLYVVVPLALIALVTIFLAGDRITEAALDFGSNPPWKEQPTRISTQLTPFADIPGFSQPTPVPTRAP